jgi:hypothetical protein
VNEMCFMKNGCKLKVFESESDLQLESRVNFVSSALWIFCCDVMY